MGVFMMVGCSDAADRPGLNGQVPQKPDYQGEDGPWALAVMASDYFSSSLSIIDLVEGQLFYEGIIDSGSALPGLTMALSGDVVLPSQPLPDNSLILIDRYPNGVLTIIEPASLMVRQQISVATGFAANPHDVLMPDGRHLWVSRYEVNPRAGKEAFDGGSDILIVDMQSGDVTGRIDLSSCADDGLWARPDRLLQVDDKVWVSLNHLSEDFTAAGPARFAVLDIASGSLDRVVEVPDLSNCKGMVYDAAADRIYSSCSSLFRFNVDFDPATSGVVALDPGAADGNPEVLVTAADDDGQPYGFDIDLDGSRVVVMRFGDLDADIPDQLLALDPAMGQQHHICDSATAFGMGGFWAEARSGLVYVGDADPTTPRVHVYGFADGLYDLSHSINTHPGCGLPPRAIRPY